jgi:hypothetical protein
LSREAIMLGEADEAARSVLVGEFYLALAQGGLLWGDLLAAGDDPPSGGSSGLLVREDGPNRP